MTGTSRIPWTGSVIFLHYWGQSLMTEAPVKENTDLVQGIRQSWSIPMVTLFLFFIYLRVTIRYDLDRRNSSCVPQYGQSLLALENKSGPV